MRKYTKKSCNPEKDGLYDTNKGLYLFYQGDWYWQFRDGWTKAQYNTLPIYYFEEDNDKHVSSGPDGYDVYELKKEFIDQICKDVKAESKE